MNITISDAAPMLGISETKLRKILADNPFYTEVEERKTTTGYRKTRMIPPETMELIHGFIREKELQTHFQDSLPTPSMESDPLSDSELSCTAVFHRSAFSLDPGRQGAEGAITSDTHASSSTPAHSPYSGPSAASTDGLVSVRDFNRLQQECCGLRAEMARMNRYLQDCDQLLEQIIKTIMTVEERTRSLDDPRRGGKQQGLTGALHSLTEKFQHALVPRMEPHTPRTSSGSSQVYFANSLTRR